MKSFLMTLQKNYNRVSTWLLFTTCMPVADRLAVTHFDSQNMI